MELDKQQTNEVFNTYFKTQLLLWERWVEFVRQIEAATPATDRQEAADPLKFLSEQAQNAVELNKAWAQLWIDSLEHSNAMMKTLAMASNHHFEGYQARIKEHFEGLAEQVRKFSEQARILDMNQGWVRRWIEQLDRDRGVVNAVIAWNRQIVDRQIEARKQFLDTWLETFQDIDPFRCSTHLSTQHSLEALQEAIDKAMAIPFGLPAPALLSGEKPTPPARHPQKQAKAKTA